MTDHKLPVVEIFGPTVQGEGALAGKLSHFLRLGLCDGAAGTGRSSWCSWCDSMFAVDGANMPSWEMLTEREIEDRVNALPESTRTLTITGGNPALYDLSALTMNLTFQRWNIWIETQGTRHPDWLAFVNVTCSPKPPSAHDDPRAVFALVEQFMQERRQSGYATAIKIPIDPDEPADKQFAATMFERFKWADPYLSVVTYPDDDQLLVIDRWRKVADWAFSGALGTRVSERVSVLPQLHVLLWLHEKGR